MSKAISRTNAVIESGESKKGASNTLQFVLVAIAIVAIGVLAFAAHTTPYWDFDLSIAHALQSIQAPWFDALMHGVGIPGYPPQVYVWLAVVLLGLWFTGRRWEAVSLLFVTIGIGALGLAIKIPVDRPRPSPQLIQVANPALDGGKYSFPAGHVEVFVAIFGFFIYLIYKASPRQWWHYVLVVLFAVMILGIGPSRIYVGEHWFSDVVGAYIVGAVWLWVSIRFYEWGKDRFFKEKQASVSTARAN
ncbi:MAG TPA: phosphatase PAP2 family protein [Anaerolineae bacterium]|nr:phosphatase PAP2 family protein [Anaerolineae bacterium]